MSNSAQPNYKGLPVQKYIFLFLGKAIPVIILFVITILYSRKLSYEDYGKFQSIWMYTNLLNVIISFGITSLLLSSNLSSLITFLKINLTIITWAYTLLSGLTVVMFFLIEKHFSLSIKSLLILFVVVQSISSVWETLLLKLHKEIVILLINFLYSLLFLVWHYYILMHQFNLNYLIIGVIFISIAKLVVMVLIKQRHQIANEPPDDTLYYKHWIFLGLNDITGVLSRWIDKLLLIYLLTPGDFAIFFNGSFEIPLFGLLVSVIASVMLIEVSKDTSTKERVMQLFRESCRLSSLIVFPLFLFLIFFKEELFGVIFKHKYDASIPIFLISIFIILIRINNYSSILQYYQKGSKIITGSLLDISIAVILMICFYPLLGTKGVALAIVIATYCQVMYYLWQSAKVLNTTILSFVPLKILIKTFIIMLLLYTFLYYILHDTSDNLKVVAGTIATIIFIFIGLYLFFSKKRITNYGFITKT